MIAERADDPWIIRVVVGLRRVNETSASGAIFWMVIRIMQFVHEIPCMIAGNQK